MLLFCGWYTIRGRNEEIVRIVSLDLCGGFFYGVNATLTQATGQGMVREWESPALAVLGSLNVVTSSTASMPSQKYFKVKKEWSLEETWGMGGKMKVGYLFLF